MMNRVVIVGRLTRDPDLRYTPNGVAVANFTVAANRPFKNQSGEQEADFINCVVWRNAAENLANYMKKGSLIGVDGRIQSRSYDDKDGKRVFITEVLAENIQFLEPKGTSNQDRGQPQQQQGFNQGQPAQRQGQAQDSFTNQNTNNNSNEPFKTDGQPIDISDDDLPF